MNYILFGTKVTLSEGEEHYLDLNHARAVADYDSMEALVKWYDKCGSIEKVIEGFRTFAKNYVINNVIKPLYNHLCECNIYDITESKYISMCMDDKYIDAMESDLRDAYGAIEDKEKAEMAYRDARKAYRSRWQGGGFGISGALKGAAKAGALNAISGLGHSMVNAVGNSGSAAAASASKKNLYKNKDVLEKINAVLICSVDAAFNTHASFVNIRIPDYFAGTFNFESSDALFENAKKYPDKREELLLMSFKQNPTNYNLLEYIFLNYPGERKTVTSVAKRFHVDLSTVWEQLLSKGYSQEDLESYEKTAEARYRILKVMKEYDIPTSRSLDTLETAMINKLCAGYKQMDEAGCNDLADKIKATDFQDKIKEYGLKMVQERANAIWSGEDEAAFTEIFMNINFSDPAQIAVAEKTIRSKARTNAAAKFLDALHECTPEQLEKAKLYKYSNKPKTYLILGILFIVFSYLIIPIIPAIVFIVKYFGMRNAWKTITMNGTLINPSLAKYTRTDKS